mmetsp:Transcript_22586/g.38598  ORF Transcript_22586/g.38598 Transcript_22586/m.38598 type:complete len:500 (-) Transcript_22586:454-1953(-)
MRDQDAGAVLHPCANAPLEQSLADVRVHCTERVVHEVQLAVRVQRPREGDALLLPPGKVDALLADLGLVPRGQLLDVGPQLTDVQDPVVLLAVVLLLEGDVVAERRVHDPGLLGHIRHVPDVGHAAAGVGPLDLPHEGSQEGGLPAARLPHDEGQLPLPDADVDVLQHHLLHNPEVFLLGGLTVRGRALAAQAPDGAEPPHGLAVPLQGLALLRHDLPVRRLALIPVERALLDDGGQAFALLGLGQSLQVLRAVVAVQIGLDALQGDPGVTERGLQRRHHDQGEPHDGEQRKGREDDFCGQLAAKQSVQSEDDARHNDGRQVDDGETRQPEVLLLPQALDLFPSEVKQLLGKQVLPGHNLHNADALQALIDALNTLISMATPLAAVLEHPRHDSVVHGDQDCHEEDPQQRGPSQLDVQQHTGHNELHGGAPDQVQEEGAVLQPLGIIAHHSDQAALVELWAELRGVAEVQRFAVQAHDLSASEPDPGAQHPMEILVHDQ